MAIRLRKKPPKKEEIVEESAGFKQKREEEELKQKIVELGLEKKVIELPPDEVSEKDVERDAATSILAMIPYTNAWWEAKAAEEELDGLKRIREEIGRANALPQVKEGEAKNRRTCQWRPAKDDVIHRGYLCRNPVIKNPYLPDAAPTTCGMHVAVCLRPHNDKKGAIEIPNIYGLCTLHHVSEYGAPPVPVPFPYPG
eukprot:gene3492-4339_t